MECSAALQSAVCLQDGELARLIAELSYRGAGRTLTEREYMEALERIEMARQLKEINESAEEGAGDTLRPGDQVQSSFVGIRQIRFQDTPLVTAIKQRYKENKEGSMNSIFFIYIKGENQEVSGHIDMANR